jgi:hypothetical protein
MSKVFQLLPLCFVLGCSDVNPSRPDPEENHYTYPMVPYTDVPYTGYEQGVHDVREANRDIDAGRAKYDPRKDDYAR